MLYQCIHTNATRIMIVNYMYFVVFSFLFLHVNKGEKVLNLEQESEIDDFIGELIGCKRFPGLGLSIVKNGETFAKGYGYRDVNSKKPFDADTVSCGGSTGKAFTAVLLAILMTEKNKNGHRVNWRSNIQDISSGEIRFKDETRTSEVTLLDLLTHRIGMETVDLLLITGYPDNIANRKIISKRLRNMKTIAPFREEFIYNNLMYMTAGHVAEILGGASFEELIRSRIFKPLNMTAASFMADLDFNQNVARPYDKENDTLLESDTYLYRVHSLSPAGTVCASPRDYSKWLVFLLNNATTMDGVRLIEDSLWRDMWKGRQYIGDAAETSYSLYKPFPYFRSASSYATAWFRSNYRGHKVIFHSGSFHAYSALAVVNPNIKSAFMLTINGPWPLKFSNDVVPLSYVISDILLNETRWLEVSDACSFPSRWINATSNHNRTIDVEKEYDNLTSENALMYIGRYGNPLKGEVDVYYNDGNLRAKIGFLSNVTFRYQPGNDTFDLTSDGSFQRVLNMYPTRVKFSELKNNVYNNMTIISPRLKETHSFHRNINFDAVDSTETKSSKGSSFVCSILILLTCFVSSRCSFSSKMFDFVY